MTEPVQPAPMDSHNRELLENVRPPQWTNPTAAECYNLVVVGAGPAGLVTAAGAASLGAKVALVERDLLGGDCLNTGCVPSKALIRSARAAADVNRAGQFGVRVHGDVEVDFPAVMERMRRVRTRISHHDAVERFRKLGVDVFLGQAQFTGPDTLDVDGQTLRFARACVATGARAAQPSIKGLARAGFLTNETVFSLTERPARLVVFGAGPLGCELAQTFCRLGSKVTILERQGHLLSREDRDAAEVLARSFRRDGIDVLVDSTVCGVTVVNGEKHVCYTTDGGAEQVVAADAILMGAGRAPNVEGLGLEAAGVAYDTQQGVIVDDTLRTTNRRIYAAGDVCLKHKFTHTADATARIVIRNALFWGRRKLQHLTIPWCTYTDPEIAHVGLYEHEARDKGVEIDTFAVPFDEVDRALTEGEDEGFLKVHVRKGTDRIVGATIVGPHAGDLVSEITLAVVGKVGLRTIAEVIHPYPTLAEAIKRVADAYNRTRLTPFWKRVVARILKWRR